MRAGRFLIRRGFKIYPSFYLMFFTVLAWATMNGRWPGLAPVISEALFVQNYGPAIFPHTWTLAVEEHFYLALPLVLWAVQGKKERPFAGLPIVFAAVALTCLALRVHGAWDRDTAVRASLTPTHLRVDSLLFGAVLAWGMHFHGNVVSGFVQRRRTWMLAAAILIAAPALIHDLGTTPWHFTYGFTALYLAGGALLLLALHRPARRGVFARIGIFSYSIYLWHIPVERILLPMILPAGFPGWGHAVLYFALSIFVGIITAKIVELPFLRLRDRLFPSRA